MDGKRYRIQGANTLSLPAEDAEKLLALGDGECARCIFIFCAPAACSIPPRRRALSPARESRSALRRAGSPGRAFSPPGTCLCRDRTSCRYTARRTYCAAAPMTGRSARWLGECQRVLGHTLSSADLNTLFGIYDRLGMTAETILLLIHHCADKLRRRYGEGRLPTMRAIEKEAFYWANREILTAPQAEEYLAALARRDEEMEKVRHALSLTGRDLTPTERKYIESWLSMGYGRGGACHRLRPHRRRHGQARLGVYGQDREELVREKALHRRADREGRQPRVIARQARCGKRAAAHRRGRSRPARGHTEEHRRVRGYGRTASGARPRQTGDAARGKPRGGGSPPPRDRREDPGRSDASTRSSAPI